jgi:hypothetical protein
MGDKETFRLSIPFSALLQSLKEVAGPLHRAFGWKDHRMGRE